MFQFLREERGYAVVEATILFPIIIMIFAALVLLSMYLPTRAGLQNATQSAATALATTRSDTWLQFDEDTLEYTWVTNRRGLTNVYMAVIGGLFDSGSQSDAEAIVKNTFEKNMVSCSAAEIEVECRLRNYVVYREITVTATQTIPMPVNLSFIGFPEEMPITVSSTAVVADGDEFVRNMDIVTDFISYIDEKYHLHEKSSAIFSAIGEVRKAFESLFGV